MQSSGSEETSNLKTFTTIGKPTKMINTPSGLKEIYDPQQDPELNATGFENVELVNIAKDQNIKSYVDLGCKNYILPNCYFCVMKTFTRRVSSVCV